MKIYTRIVTDWDGNEELADWFSYEGPVSLAGGGSSQKSVQQTSTGPWTQQQPYLMQGFQEAQNQYNSDKPQYFPDSTVAPQSYNTRDAINRMAEGSALPAQAGRAAGDTLSGAYLNAPETWAARTYNPNANVMAGMAANQNANAFGGVSSNPYAGAFNPYAGESSELATNANMGASNPNAGTWNPYAGVKANVGINPYLSQGTNDYIGNVTNAVTRSVVPQVNSGFAAAGRTGESPLAQTAMAKGIADAVAPYQFNSAEAEMGRRFSGGESLASRAQTASENQAQRLYGAGGDVANQLYQSGEAGAQRQFAGGETEATRLQGIRDALTQQLYGAGQEQASREYGAGESQAAREQGARDALAGRQFSSGESLAGAQRAEASAQAARQYGAGESAIQRGMSQYDAERARQLQAAGMAPELTSAQYIPAQEQLASGQLQDQQSQLQLQDQIDRYNFDQNLPAKKLADYMAMITGNYGQAGTNIGNANAQMSGADQFAKIGEGIGGIGKAFGATIICTELARAGLIDAETLNRADAFGLRHPVVTEGYLLWARPIARRMRTNDGFRLRIRDLAMPFIRKLAQGGPDLTPTGIALGIGVAACWVLGMIVARSGRLSHARTS